MLKFDENTSAVHAYLCADGYVIKNPSNQKRKYYRIGLRNTNTTLLKDFQLRFEVAFGLKPHILNSERCYIGNKQIYYELTKDFSYYSKDWRLPKMTNACLGLWLRAYFDCDGWVMVRKGRDRHIGLDSINQMGLREIRRSLDILGIKSKIKNNKNRKIHRLHIYGKHNLIKYQKLIGFLHPAKQKRLQEAIESYIDYNWKFPKEKNQLNIFILNILYAKVRNNSGRIKICSKYERNLIIMHNYLRTNLRIHSLLSKRRFNGNGIPYYELSINKNEDIKNICKLVKNKLQKTSLRY